MDENKFEVISSKVSSADFKSDKTSFGKNIILPFNLFVKANFF